MRHLFSFRYLLLVLSPNHFVDYASIGLDDLYYFIADVLDVDRNGNTVAAVTVHGNRCVYGL